MGALPSLHWLLENPQLFGQVVHESEQWDWQDLYVKKKKKFTLIEINGEPPESSSHFWMSEDELLQLAMVPVTRTSDLMVAVGLLFGHEIVTDEKSALFLMPEHNQASVKEKYLHDY
jgi:hypothetical protein